jgi:hypothetical protein
MNGIAIISWQHAKNLSRDFIVPNLLTRSKTRYAVPVSLCNVLGAFGISPALSRTGNLPLNQWG